MRRRFGRMFEVKNEMRDGKETRLDNSQPKRFQLSEDDLEEFNQVGFSDDYEIYEQDDDFIKDKNKTEMSFEEKIALENEKVAKELEENYDVDIGDEYIKAYLKDKLSRIYDEELYRLKVASVTEMVDSYFEYNEFLGVDSYRELIGNIDNVIRIMRNNERKASQKNDEKKQTISLSKEEKEKMLSVCRNFGMAGELQLNAYIASTAKKMGVEKEKLKQYLREEEKSRINSSEKILHYHRTSIDCAESIIETGYFLNRARIKERGGDISKFKGSSSNNVQFSVDMYDDKGNLISSGYNPNDNLGANSTDVVFIMGPRLIKEKTYDCFGKYPTVEQADLNNCCVKILARNQDILQEVQKKLTEKGIDIKVVLEKEFNREKIISELTTIHSKVDSVGYDKREIQRSSGKDILDSAIRATKKSVDVSEIEEQRARIVKRQRERMMSKETGYVIKHSPGERVLESAITATEKSMTMSMIEQQVTKILDLQEQSVQKSIVRK